MTVVQAPIDLSLATRVGPRVWRKQVLAKRAIDYPLGDGSTQRVDFDDAYLRDLAAAFRDGAYDLVPFQLATARNEHNEDPRQYGGRITGLEVTPDGLDAIIELSAEAAELVERTGRGLGVSPRIKAVQHVDGRSFKRAIRHVLGTLDPRMQNMAPWQPVVDLAAEDSGDVIVDLSGFTYREASAMPQLIDLSQLSVEQRDSLESWAAAEGIDLSESDPDVEVGVDVEVDTGDDDADEDDADPDEDDAEGDDDQGGEGGEEGGISDDELNDLIDRELATADTSVGFADPHDLSNPDDADLDLAAYATAGDDAQLDADDPVAENRRLRLANARGHYLHRGVPPHLVDLAAPVLMLADSDVAALDLATPDGEALDVRSVVRGMLDAVAGAIDLSTESGYGHDDTDDPDQVATAAGNWIDYIENNT